MTSLTWVLLLAGVALNAAAQLLLKAATRVSGALVADTGAVSWVAALKVLQTVPLWLGLSCYAVSVFLWIAALSRAPVSIAYPLVSIGYVVNAFAAALLFGEPLTVAKLAGIALIIGGVYILARAAQ
jgi:multidrug transporter EmrE-like cation transporter